MNFNPYQHQLLQQHILNINGHGQYVKQNGLLPTPPFPVILAPAPPPVQVPGVLTHLNSSHSDDQVNKFMDWVAMKEEDVKNRMEMIDELQKLLHFGKLHVFGSFLTGVGDSSSDVDIYFEDYENRKNLVVLEEVRKTIKGKLKTNNNNNDGDDDEDGGGADTNAKEEAGAEGESFGTIVQTLRNTRIPILTFQHSRTKVKSDLSFENIMSVQNSKLLQFYIQLDPVVKPLIILLRHWASHHNLIDKRIGLKKYAISLLAIVYLVKRNFIPSIDILQSLVPKMKVDSWNVAFCDDMDKVKKLMKKKGIGRGIFSPAFRPGDILPMIVDFFNFLKCVLDYEYVVCTSSAELIPVIAFNTRNAAYGNLSPKHKELVRSLGDDVIEKLLSRGSIVLMDPFEKRFNVTNGINFTFSLKIVSAIRKTMQSIYQSGPMSPIQLSHIIPRLPSLRSSSTTTTTKQKATTSTTTTKVNTKTNLDNDNANK